MLKRSLFILAGFLLAAPWALQAQTPKTNDAGITAPNASILKLYSESGCPSVYGIIGSGSVDLPGTSGTQSPRIYRNGIPSSCAVPKAWPGFYGEGSFAYDAYTLTNPTGSPQCVNMNLYVYDSEVGDYVHLTVYSGSFNPGSISTNYLADSGSSAAYGGSVGLSVTVGAGQSIVVVMTNPFGTGTGQDYLFSYDNLCITYDRSYRDDRGRSMVCYNSYTGYYQWSILMGLGAGDVYLGQANVSNGGNTLLSSSSDPLRLVLNVYPIKGSALGFFHPASFGNQNGNILMDSNIYNNPPSDCLPQIDTVKR